MRVFSVFNQRLLLKARQRSERLLFGGNRPDFLIVGAQKSGTTSLFSYLKEIDGFLGSTKKEIHFFDREDNFARGNRWYEEHFVRRPGEEGLFYEATPEYLVREKVSARLLEYDPSLKIIILLREPISRAYSAWNMYRKWSQDGNVPGLIQDDEYGRDESPLFRTFFANGCPSFSTYIRLELSLIQQGDLEAEPSILRRGIYKPQVERYVDCFGWENLLILGFNELRLDSEAVIRRCHEFLGVTYRDTGLSEQREMKNKRIYTSRMDPEDQNLLKEFYNDHNQDLYAYLGFQPDW